jgi:hypothetical protein
MLGASVKDNGLANCGRGWSLIYKARALPLGPPKMQLLELSVDLFKEHVQLHPNDWVANYDAGSVYVYVHVCVYLYVHACMNECMYVCMYVCIYIL